MKVFNRYQIIMFVLSLAAIFTAIFWIIIISPNLIIFLSNYSNIYSYFGELKTFDPTNQSVKQIISIDRKLMEKTENAKKNIANMKRVDSIINSLNQEVLLHKDENFTINKKKGYYANENQKNLFAFPKNAQKNDYQEIIYPVHPGITAQNFYFSNEENIFGISVFVFRYKIENYPTKPENLTLTFLNYNQEKITADYWGKIWVEPKTGSVIRQENNWGYSITNKIIESGRLWQQDEEIKRNIRIAKSKKAVFQLLELWIPVYLLLFALAFAMGAFIKGKSRIKT